MILGQIWKPETCMVRFKEKFRSMGEVMFLFSSIFRLTTGLYTDFVAS